MRHRKSGVKLNRTTSHRQAMFRNMVTSLLKHEKIKTTAPKAKELRKWADHVITLAKRGDLHARRQAMSIVREKDLVHKLFEEASERFGARNGGYTRIVRIGHRPGDAAPLTIIELLGSEDTKPVKTQKSVPAVEEEKVFQEPTALKEEASAAEDADETAATEETPDADTVQEAKEVADVEKEAPEEIETTDTLVERNEKPVEKS